MAKIKKKKFNKIIEKYKCAQSVADQIKEAVVITKIPDDDFEPGTCLIELADKSKRFLLPVRRTRYFFTEFNIFYLLEAIPTSNCPMIELTFNSAEELTIDEFEFRRSALPEEKTLKEAISLINPGIRLKIGND